MTNPLPLLDRHRAVLPAWQALYYKEPIALVSGEGRRVRDANGAEYLDFFGGILTTMTGHNVPEVVEAIRAQAGEILHTSTLYLSDNQVELAEEIARLSGIPDARVFLTTSGSEANDAALMLAAAYRRSNQILAMRHSYHGRTSSTVAVTGQRAWSPTSFHPYAVAYVHGAYPYRSPFRGLADEAYIKACTDDLEEMLAVATAGDVACLIAEPILGVGGFATPPDGLYGAFQRTLKDRGVLFISDEVQTGWGRTGATYWGYEAHGVAPDIITFAKGVGNGLPIAGLVARAEVMNAFNVSSISTFGGNPLTTRAALANLRYALKHDLQGNALRQGAALRAGLDPLAEENGVIGEVRGKGLMIGLEFVEAGSRTPNPAAATRFHEETKARGLLVGRGGAFGNVIRIAPPLSVTADETAEGLEILLAAAAALR